MSRRTRWGLSHGGHSWIHNLEFGCITGFGLGRRTVALFGCVGVGTYTKAADVAADLAGKIGITDLQTGQRILLDESSPDNPAVIADNIGDIAEMGAELFGIFAEPTCAASVLIAITPQPAVDVKSIMYPIPISTTGIVVGPLTLLLVTPINKN